MTYRVLENRARRWQKLLHFKFSLNDVKVAALRHCWRRCEVVRYGCWAEKSAHARVACVPLAASLFVASEARVARLFPVMACRRVAPALPVSVALKNHNSANRGYAAGMSSRGCAPMLPCPAGCNDLRCRAHPVVGWAAGTAQLLRMCSAAGCRGVSVWHCL